VLSRADVAKKARDNENNIVIWGATQRLTSGRRENMEHYMIAVVSDSGKCGSGYRCTYLSNDIGTGLSAPNVHRGSQHGRTSAEASRSDPPRRNGYRAPTIQPESYGTIPELEQSDNNPPDRHPQGQNHAHMTIESQTMYELVQTSGMHGSCGALPETWRR